jgi:hypothetical protein
MYMHVYKLKRSVSWIWNGSKDKFTPALNQSHSHEDTWRCGGIVPDIPKLCVSWR